MTINPHFKQLLFLGGGIPRYLQFVLHSLLGEIKSSSLVNNELIEDLNLEIKELNSSSFNRVVQLVKDKTHLSSSRLSVNIFKNIVALCVS
jgi:hypothetical protein